MIRTLQRHGNSSALVIDKALREARGIDGSTPSQVTLNGTTLVVTPVEVRFHYAGAETPAGDDVGHTLAFRAEGAKRPAGQGATGPRFPGLVTSTVSFRTGSSPRRIAA